MDVEQDDPLAGPDRDMYFYYDVSPHRITGWAASERFETVADAVTLTLTVGAIALGTVPRAIVRSDVNDYLGYTASPSGFGLDDFGLTAFARMCGLSDIGISLTAYGFQNARYPLPLPAVDTAAGAMPLGMGSKKPTAFRMSDLWFENRRDLAFRFENVPDERRLDAYQCAPGIGLVRVATELPIDGLLSVVTVRLLNPFLPVLIVLRDVNGGIEAIDFLPFPSLVRGGQHAAERILHGRGGAELTAVAALSEDLLVILMAEDQPGTSVSTIELDNEVHTGFEPMLDDDLLAWITGFLGIAVVPPKAPRHAELGFIRERLARHDAAARPGHTLLVPADAIPTIAALVHRLPPGTCAQTVAGGFGVVEWNRHGRIWSVWTPPVGDWLEAVQWREAKRTAPILRVSGPDADGIGKPAAPDWPLALVMREKPVKNVAEGIFEIASEIALPLLRGPALSNAAPVTIVILFDRDDTSPVPLIESLARQQGLVETDLVICRPEGSANATLQAALTAHFPDRVIVTLPPQSGKIEQLVAVRERLTHDTVLVVSSDTVLPDQRTLATLLPMLAQPGVSTAGCLLRPAAKPNAAACAGYVTVGLDLRVLPGLMFDTVDPAVFRQPTTYPVVATPLGAIVMRRDVLNGLDAYGSDSLRPEVDDLLLGLHVIEGGGINLCTTIVSAFSERLPRSRQLTLVAPYRLSPRILAGIAGSAVLVQKVQ